MNSHRSLASLGREALLRVDSCLRAGVREVSPAGPERSGGGAQRLDSSRAQATPEAQR